MKFHPVLEMKNVGERIWNFPAHSHRRLHVEVFITLQKVIKDELINALRLTFQSNPGFKIGGTAFDNHYQGCGIGGTAAREQRKNQQGTENCRRKAEPTGQS